MVNRQWMGKLCSTTANPSKLRQYVLLVPVTEAQTGPGLSLETAFPYHVLSNELRYGRLTPCRLQTTAPIRYSMLSVLWRGGMLPVHLGTHLQRNNSTGRANQ